MNQIVERLLTLARLDAGVAQVRPEPVNVRELVDRCIAVIKPLADARGLTMSVRGGPLVMSSMDPAKLREITTNLLYNAVQYNNARGSVDVVLSTEAGQLRLEVRDTGIGISPADQARIFERFYRADSSRHTDDLNAGLGLAIVKGYVDLMGGSVDVKSAQGKGSTFSVRLPPQPARVA